MNQEQRNRLREMASGPLYNGLAHVPGNEILSLLDENARLREALSFAMTSNPNDSEKALKDAASNHARIFPGLNEYHCFIAGAQWQRQRDQGEIEKLREALHFYGFEAIHNPTAKSKSEQYWNDQGIWDHGEKAREALK